MNIKHEIIIWGDRFQVIEQDGAFTYRRTINFLCEPSMQEVREQKLDTLAKAEFWYIDEVSAWAKEACEEVCFQPESIMKGTVALKKCLIETLFD